MAKFVKRDGKQIHLVRAPTPGTAAVIGTIEDFEVNQDHITHERKIILTLVVSETDVEKMGGLVPVIFDGSRVLISVLEDGKDGFNPEDDDPVEELAVKDPEEDEVKTVEIPSEAEALDRHVMIPSEGPSISELFQETREKELAAEAEEQADFRAWKRQMEEEEKRKALLDPPKNPALEF